MAWLSDLSSDLLWNQDGGDGQSRGKGRLDRQKSGKLTMLLEQVSTRRGA